MSTSEITGFTRWHKIEGESCKKLLDWSLASRETKKLTAWGIRILTQCFSTFLTSTVNWVGWDMTWKVFSLNPNCNICCTISSYKITQTNFSNSIFFRRKKKKRKEENERERRKRGSKGKRKNKKRRRKVKEEGTHIFSKQKLRTFKKLGKSL